MSKFTAVSTDELSRAALSWAVFHALYKPLAPKIVVIPPSGNDGEPEPVFPGAKYLRYTGMHGYETHYMPHCRWDQVGELIHKYGIQISPGDIYQERGGDWWGATMMFAREGEPQSLYDAGGETPQQAACRVIVLAKLGETVQIPSVLC